MQTHVSLTGKDVLKVALRRRFLDPRRLNGRMRGRDRERIGVAADLLQRRNNQDFVHGTTREAIIQATSKRTHGATKVGANNLGSRSIGVGT